MASGTLTSSEYIKHHLTNLTFGKNPQTGEWGFAHTAQEAADMGLVNHCVSHDELMDKAMEYANQVANLPIAAVRWTKMAVNQMLKNSMGSG